MKWFKYFFYISLFFLLIALIKAEYFVIPVIYSVNYLILSFFFLFTVFIFSCITWMQIIQKSNFPVTLNQSIASLGLSIFGKYIPGKVWIILGRATYIAEKKNIPKNILTTISLNEQFITLWVGFILGAIGLFFINGLNIWGNTILIFWIILTIIIFTNIPHKIIESFINKIFKRNINFPRLSFINVFKILPWFLLNWIFWCLGFYFLTKGLTNNDVSLYIGLGFALGAILGIILIFAPGGIGIRESVLTGYLTLAGFEIQEATTIAVASRLWFLTGECFIFCLGNILDKFEK